MFNFAWSLPLCTSASESMGDTGTLSATAVEGHGHDGTIAGYVGQTFLMILPGLAIRNFLWHPKWTFYSLTTFPFYLRQLYETDFRYLHQFNENVH